MRVLILVLLIPCFTINSGLSQGVDLKVIKLKADKGSLNLGEKVSFFEDKTAKLDFEDILDNQDKFELSTTKALNFGVTSSVIWVKFVLSNSTPDLTDNWLLTLDYPLFDHLSFYEYKENSWEVIQSGDTKKVSTRVIPNRNFIFPIHLPDPKPRTFFMRFQTQGSMQINLVAKTELEFAKDESFSELGYGLAYGFMLVMILYNLFIYFSLRDKNYLLYVFSTLSITLLQLFYSGHLIYFTLGEYPKFANAMMPMLMASTNIFAPLFAIHFLETKKFAPRSRIVLWVVIILSILDVIAAFFLPTRITISFAGMISLFMTFYLIFTGFTTYLNGHTAARFFLIAWIALLIGAILISFRNFGLVESNFLTVHGLKIGSIAEVVLLSLALSDRYNLFKKEKEAAQAEALRIQKEANETLETKVKERTFELEEANHEINRQMGSLLELNQEIQSQKEEIQTQRDALEQALVDISAKNTQITSSINYAKRIQSAMLPDLHMLKEILPESFVMYRPRDIVSGDFYYIEEEQGKIIIAAIDCTGHGVPGAFMSMMGNEILDRIIKEKHIVSANIILDELHKGVKSSLKQVETNNRDGMDVALCVIDLQQKTLDFAGAKNPLCYIQGGEFKVMPGGRYSIGGDRYGKDFCYACHTIDISQPTQIFIYSDGYADEFGGPKGRKFMTGEFKRLLHQISSKPAITQQKILEETMNQWLGVKYSQIDDILVIGVKL